jgi:hypothetical protein
MEITSAGCGRSAVTVPVKSKTWRSRPMRKITRECCVATDSGSAHCRGCGKEASFVGIATRLYLCWVSRSCQSNREPGGPNRNHASIVRKPRLATTKFAQLRYSDPSLDLIGTTFAGGSVRGSRQNDGLLGHGVRVYLWFARKSRCDGPRPNRPYSPP